MHTIRVLSYNIHHGAGMDGVTDLARIANIIAAIPNQDLAIQWDCTSELQDAYGQFPDVPADDLIERNMVSLGRLCTLVPEAAELGYHLCYGTLGGWPRWEPDDLGGAVTLANAFAGHSRRRVENHASRSDAVSLVMRHEPPVEAVAAKDTAMANPATARGGVATEVAKVDGPLEFDAFGGHGASLLSGADRLLKLHLSEHYQ